MGKAKAKATATLPGGFKRNDRVRVPTGEIGRVVGGTTRGAVCVKLAKCTLRFAPEKLVRSC